MDCRLRRIHEPGFTDLVGSRRGPWWLDGPLVLGGFLAGLDRQQFGRDGTVSVSHRVEKGGYDFRGGAGDVDGQCDWGGFAGIPSGRRFRGSHGLGGRRFGVAGDGGLFAATATECYATEDNPEDKPGSVRHL
jgi:hypothetical protein